MADMKLFQVTVDANGNAVSALELPPEVEKTRTIFIREETERAAKRKAESFFSLAK